jgi:hypothetical protein
VGTHKLAVKADIREAIGKEAGETVTAVPKAERDGGGGVAAVGYRYVRSDDQ